ncbi:DUF5605 domain-containing protein [Paenibacillus sp. XY044]|uniref:DUF5605 domain-containing protein n=1 Tax=Paenibacillus sp. XY044 TaxID=2026089 RepID=UPI000B98A537|nr:DUF5605 domain-containing protein [Paenibacillus sp. XY044]OZB98217.1 DUF5060 domain-containing protein [Paenibacillus sp. XY044]
MITDNAVERWAVYETAIHSSEAIGNPYRDVWLLAVFRNGDRVVKADGFYDGDGVYKIRFMPDSVGRWVFSTKSNMPSMDGITGEFDCTDPGSGNHGMVRVVSQDHFEYEDGTPYMPFGTTCYAWIHQSESVQDETLGVLKTSPFNKIRMCVFPKRYTFNTTEPELFPFAGSKELGFDLDRFEPRFFRKLERRIEQLGDLGIEADIILFHPYDKGHWGFDRMSPEVDEAYLRYVIARLSAYRNVWWSLANEYDFMREKRMEDWDRFFQMIRQHDPYQHLRSIHNGTKMYDPTSLKLYDHSKAWVDHVSLQHWDLTATDSIRRQFHKPVVIDECCYEGDIPRRWGNISGEEMTHRFWEGMVRGAYVGHGETYLHKDDIIWWSHGGQLHGTSPERIRFLRQILEDTPQKLVVLDTVKDVPALGSEGRYYLLYFGVHRPALFPMDLPEGNEYKAEVIDTRKMTIERLEGTYSGACTIPLPGKPYLALRIRLLDPEAGFIH